MDWFSGSIPEAIGTSKSRNALFVVFISDSSAASSTTEATLDSSADELTKHVVAIKVESSSEDAKQFSQIYPVTVVPSLHFINPVSGVPVEVLTGAVNGALLADKLQGIVAAGKAGSSHGASNGSSVASTSSSAAEGSHDGEGEQGKDGDCQNGDKTNSDTTGESGTMTADCSGDDVIPVIAVPVEVTPATVQVEPVSDPDPKPAATEETETVVDEAKSATSEEVIPVAKAVEPTTADQAKSAAAEDGGAGDEETPDAAAAAVDDGDEETTPDVPAAAAVDDGDEETTPDAAAAAAVDDGDEETTPDAPAAAAVDDGDQETTPDAAAAAAAVDDGDQETTPDAAVEQQGAQSASTVSLAERIANAKVLAEEKLLQRGEESRQKQLTEEVQRRQVGKDVRRIKKEQEDKELKSLAAQRRKDKEDDKAARQAIMVKIAADREERTTRAAILRGEEPPAAPSSPSQPPAAVPSSAAPAPSVCRLKLRLPDGSSVLAQFPPSSPLSAVHQHVVDNIPLPHPQFRLAASLRQGPFTDQDMDITLADLGLAPSAILVIVPQRPARSTISKSVAAEGGILNTILYMLLVPFNAVVAFLRAFIGGGDAPTQPRPADDTQPPAEDGGEGDAGRRRADRPKTAYGTRDSARYRREGNIHRLRNTDDDDDENNTWNGNSTQQM